MMTDGEAETPNEGVPVAAEETTEQEAPGTIFDDVETPATKPVENPEDLVDTPTKPDEPTDSEESERPEWLPEKFKTPEDLVKAYNEMGKKIREKSEPPESYDIKVAKGEDGEPEAIELSEHEQEMFKEAGLTNDQAEKITQYFHDEVIPQIMEARTELEKDRLAFEWNVDKDSNAFTQQLAQVKAWAQQNLPDVIVNELSKSSAGVKTLANMMEQGAQSHRVTGTAAESRPDKSQLMELMNDERYWSGDEDYRSYVRKQFERAYD